MRQVIANAITEELNDELKCTNELAFSCVYSGLRFVVTLSTVEGDKLWCKSYPIMLLMSDIIEDVLTEANEALIDYFA